MSKYHGNASDIPYFLGHAVYYKREKLSLN